MTDKAPPRESSIHLAAQCWCDEETKNIEMDTRLAVAFAKRYDTLQARLDKCEKLLSDSHYQAEDLSVEIDQYFEEVDK